MSEKSLEEKYVNIDIILKICYDHVEKKPLRI
jgi:hypothetical protein